MLTDECGAVLEPLVDACCPKSKTPPADLRRTVSAIVRRHKIGAKWRAIPDRLRAVVAGGADVLPMVSP